ncbi:MAG TPA: hypothetical protein ENN63_08115 [Bacteroidetes bacterium]|nr:hypothetical protein [Bacteroidota bacterium]
MAAAAAGLLELFDDQRRGSHASPLVDGNSQSVHPENNTTDGKRKNSQISNVCPGLPEYRS